MKSKKTAPIPTVIRRQRSKNNNSQAQLDNETESTCPTPATVETVISHPLFPNEMKHYSTGSSSYECKTLLEDNLDKNDNSQVDNIPIDKLMKLDPVIYIYNHNETLIIFSVPIFYVLDRILDGH